MSKEVLRKEFWAGYLLEKMNTATLVPEMKVNSEK